MPARIALGQLVKARGVLADDLALLLLRDPHELVEHGPHRVGPVGLDVGIIGGPEDVLDAEVVAALEPEPVGDEGGVDILAEVLARHPLEMALDMPALAEVVVIDRLEEEGDPADAGLDRHDLTARELLE